MRNIFHGDASQQYLGHKWLILALLATLVFSLATCLVPHFESHAPQGQSNTGPLAALLGDGRRLFANHFFVKADAYFHSGYYPSIYDNRESFQTPHIGEDSGQMEGRNTGDEHSFLGQPRDWIERFNRNFFPSEHTHLDEGGADGGGAAQVKEILPWLKISTEMDPNRVETYTVTAYWLRKRMKLVHEAEQFLRDGLRANPNNSTLQLELGRLYFEDRKDPVRARNLFEAALGNWRKENANKSESDKFLFGQITGALADLERHEGRIAQAIEYFQMLKTVSAYPDAIQKQIDELERQSNPKP